MKQSLFISHPLCFGLSQSHVTTLPEGILNPTVHEDFLSLKELAKESGIDLCIVSSFRSFERQKEIWNAKAQGLRELCDDFGDPLCFEELEEEQVLKAILRWSALPGLSRHHWGTDFDIVDQHALDEKPDYNLRLVPEEYSATGIFSNLNSFLMSYFIEKKGRAFFRPYQQDLGGVAPEPWHISHIKESKKVFDLITFEEFKNFLNGPHMADLELLDLVKEKAKEIFNNYHLNISNS